MESARAGRTVGRARPDGRPAAGRGRPPFAPGPAGLSVLGGAVAVLVAALAHATVAGQPWLPPGAAGWGLPALAAALAAPSLLPAHRAARPSGAVAPLALAGLLLHGPAAALLLAALPAVAPAVHPGHRRSALIRAACELVAVAAACAAVTLAGLATPGEAPWTPEQWWSSAVPALLVGGGVHLAARRALTTRCLPPSARPAGPARPAVAAAALLSAAPLIIVVAAHAPVLLPLFAPALGALDVALRSARARATDRLLDPLTGLPNRRWLLQRTRDALAQAESGGGRCALVLIDLDRFRSVNDTLGHGTGDRLLLEIAERVERSAPAGAETARLGADEFAVLLPAVASVGAAHRAAREVVRAIEAPVELDGLTVVVEASAGVAVYPDHAAARTGPGPRTQAGDGAAHATGTARPVSHGAGEEPRHAPQPATGAPATAADVAEEPGAVAGERSTETRRPRLPVRGVRRPGDPAAGVPAPATTRRRGTVPPPAAAPVAVGPADGRREPAVSAAPPAPGGPPAADAPSGRTGEDRPPSPRARRPVPAGPRGVTSRAEAGGADSGRATGAAGRHRRATGAVRQPDRNGADQPGRGPAPAAPPLPAAPPTVPPLPAEPPAAALPPSPPAAAAVPATPGHGVGPDSAPPGGENTAPPRPAVPRPGRRPCGRSQRTRRTEGASPGARAAEALLRQADVALSEAKRSGRPAVEVYDRSRDRHTPGRLALLGDLRAALDTGQVRLHYQPKVRFDGSVAGLEALVRWDHPERGRVAPDEFIAVAESSGLMPRLTDYVLETALAQVARWRTDGIAVPVAVNVSPRDVHTPGFAGAVAARLARHGVPAGALQLEITEHVLLDDPQQAADTLAGLTGHGVRMSLDDFGTGYSSLVHLRRLPVSELKIDRAFVARLAEDGEDAEIVRCTVELAHSLGLAVVAEGVEDGETWNRLRDLGCDAVQGWLLAPAMPASRTTRWLRDHHTPTVADGAPAPAPAPGRERVRSTEGPTGPAF